MNRKRIQQPVFPLLSKCLINFLVVNVRRITGANLASGEWSRTHALFCDCYFPYHVCCVLNIPDFLTMAAALAAANVQLTLQQAFCQDKFHLYRNGLSGANDDLRGILARASAGNPAAVARRANINARFNTIPRPGYFRFTLWHRARLGAIAAAKREPFRERTLSPPPRPDADTREEVKDQLNNFRALLRTTLRYVKCLGWGRDGVITLWRYRPTRGQDHRVVLKQSARVVQRGRRQEARPILDTRNILDEKIVMTVSRNLSPNSSPNICLGVDKSMPVRCYVEHPTPYSGSY